MPSFWQTAFDSSLALTAISMSAMMGTLMYFGPPGFWSVDDVVAYHRIIDPLAALALTALTGNIISAVMLDRPTRSR